MTSGSPSIGMPTPSKNKIEASESTTPVLVICRNKHWKFISSYHGPWLQLPPEVLESLANSNFASPRPRPIDPAVFFDLVKVRRLVEDATDLAVRASNGTTSSSLSNSLNAGNGMVGGGGATALGLGLGGGANTKLSRERKHRMRELATQKLSYAYHLDEIAASVATMQSASSLEDVAKLVLQRSTHDSDAKYVHFFHEKIPSRFLAQCTTLKPLDEVIQDHPTDGAYLRTRAVTRIFKDDFPGAAQDLTEALALYRRSITQHKIGTGQTELFNALKGPEKRSGRARDWKNDLKVEEEDHPSSLEPQLLFHRAGVYLAIACQQVHAALDESGLGTEASHKRPPISSQSTSSENSGIDEAQEFRLEARKLVKANAKRALRDYIGFLSNFEYTSGMPAELSEDFLCAFKAAANDSTNPKWHSANRLLEVSENSSLRKRNLSDALVPDDDKGNGLRSGKDLKGSSTYPALPPSEVYNVSSLLSSSPPANLPPYPNISKVLVPRRQMLQSTTSDSLSDKPLVHSEHHEAVTYHPLLTDALHSVLLCHSLIQTSPTEHLRHAHMVARLARVCDSYPIFLAARSPSRADWIEVVRRANNWIGLRQSWETLCAPNPLPSHAGSKNKEETQEQAKERRRQGAIMEALADERVHDEASFQAAVSAREERAEEQRMEDLNQNSNFPGRWAQENGKECPISTERAEAVAKWVKEAPVTIKGGGRAKRGAKKVKGKNGPFAHQLDVDTGQDSLVVDADQARSRDSTVDEALDEQYLSMR